MEIVLTVLIALAAVYILIKTISRKLKGKCDCNCSECKYKCNNVKRK